MSFLPGTLGLDNRDSSDSDVPARWLPVVVIMLDSRKETNRSAEFSRELLTVVYGISLLKLLTQALVMALVYLDSTDVRSG